MQRIVDGRTVDNVVNSRTAVTAPVEALLVIDAQLSVFGDQNPVPNSDTVLSRLGDLLSSARRGEALVVHLQHDGPPGSPDAPGTPGWEIHPALAPLPGEPVLRKTTDDGFAGTPLAQILAESGVRRVAVTGVLSEMCVSATARAAMGRGLSVVLVSDAHATYDLDDIPAAVVSRVAEHALGDQVELAGAAEVHFVTPPNPPAR